MEHATVPLLTNEGSFSKASAPPFFLEDENIFLGTGRTAPAARGPIPLWHDYGEIIQIMFVRAPWGVLACSRTHVLT